MKVKVILKILERDGWYVARIRGSHRQLKHPHKAGLVTVLGKPSDELAPGTLASILKQSSQAIRYYFMKYLVIIETTTTGFSAYSPDLPGCVATGKTKQEVEQNMSEAIAFHLEGMRLEGLTIPEPLPFLPT